ncbi:MAG: PD40 domain-containing protein [Acidobacteria bacterium]|nr:PD40 domain-containing protein [Acidobacteriota bacterium]
MSRTHRGRTVHCRWAVAGLVGLFALGWAAESMAQNQQFFPYYGKNRVKYDDFEWHIYETDHFEIFYYPELEEHLARVASYAESAYAQISADLMHDLATRVPLVVFKTHSEFEQQNIAPGQSPEGVGAFAEPFRQRIVLPIDEPPDQLYRLITHELTHQFAFDIIPRSFIRRGIPLWVDEGLADYMAGVWRPLDLMSVRDAALSDILPRMSEFLDYGGFANARVVYNLGHAAFEFIEERWGKEGVRQFLFSLRKTVIGGGGDIYEDAFDLSADEFDDAFESYIRDRFLAFRDKERPEDYGRDLAPDPRETRYLAVVSIEPSPSGDLIAAFAQNRKDRELDIVLLSSENGEVVSNLTEGFDQDLGFESIAISGARWNTVPWMSWSEIDDRIAYFVRKGKYRSLVLQNVVTRDIEEIIDLNTVDQPESPDISPNGRRVAFSALQNAIGDIYLMDLDTHEVTNLTEDDFADYAPTFSPDGSYLVYLARISGNNKLFKLDLETKEKTQLTFGTFSEAAAQFIDDHTLVFSSTATDPLLPVDPDVAANGDIFNIWTLDLNNGELRQFTDTATGNVSPIVLPGEDETRIAFVTYFKGEYGIHTIVRDEPLYTASTTDYGGPGPTIDFQAPLTHTVIYANTRRKGRFEKMFLDGAPPINIGVTNSGDFLGGTAITFSDVLGDQSFSVYAYSISQYRTLSASYVNLSGRLQFALQGFSQESFFYGTTGFFSPALAFLSRDQAIAVQTVRGGTAFGIYPFDRFRRIEISGGLYHTNERFDNPALEQQANQFQQQQFGVDLFRNGTSLPLGINFIQETTVFREFGPIAGNTMRFGYQYAPSIGTTFLGKQTLDADARYYLRLGETGLLAVRGRAFKSFGDFPDFLFFGGNSEMRGYEYLEFIGHNGGFVNAELRFPLIEAMLTPIGVLGGIRGAFFFNLGGAGLNDQPFQLFSRSTEIRTPTIGFAQNPTTGEFIEVLGTPTTISGFRLVDGRASYGIGLQTFIIGFPIHVDWSWRTLFNKAWEDVLFSGSGGGDAFRRVKFDFWIGYDF